MSKIVVPINATAIPADQREKQRLRVAAKSGKEIVSAVVSVASGDATAELSLDTAALVTVAVGPASATAEDLFLRKTLTVTVRPQIEGGTVTYKVNPIVITLPIWKLWLIWCRTFTISGYVYGTDGNPVPSAQVSAYNVDWFWWWSSTGQVGPTATTDATGHFSIQFTWCCGWLPWYWWELHPWRLDPILVEKIQSVLKLDPSLHVGPPSPKLSLSFSDTDAQLLTAAKRIGPRSTVNLPELNPTTLAANREKLLNLLPTVPEFERFCLWPWCPWTPWLDCDPNIIFKVTQNCNGSNNVIVNQNVWQAHIDIPTNYTVNLTANSLACTIPPQQGQPEGACFLFTAACGVAAEDIGVTGSGALAGFADPGSEDRPFTGSVGIYGQFGLSSTDPDYADYYAVQYRPAGTTPWLAVPSAALQPFSMTYFDATQAPPNQWSNPVFSPVTLPLTGMPGQFAQVYMSSQFFQLSNPTPPNDWGNPLTGQVWTNNIDQIAAIDTAGFFADGAYEFQIVGYTFESSDGSISPNGALIGCGLPDAEGHNYNNDFTLYFANPTPGETVPDTAINSAYFNGAPLPACGIQTLPAGTPFNFAVNFTASDAEGFLDSYSLALQWGTNPPTPLVSCGCSLATPATCGLSAAAGVEVGPCYADAIAEGATRPNWSGGTMTLTVANALTLFPQNCAYDLILTVAKRNIVDCDGDDYYQETVYYSFTVLYS